MRILSRPFAKPLLCLLILGVALIGSVAGWYEYEVHRSQGAASAPFAVHILSGESVDAISTLLERNHVISSNVLFDLDARTQDLQPKLQAGIYFLRPNMSIDEMVHTLGAQDALVAHQPAMFATADPKGKLLAGLLRLVKRIAHGAHITNVQATEPTWTTWGCDGSWGWTPVEVKAIFHASLATRLRAQSLNAFVSWQRTESPGLFNLTLSVEPDGRTPYEC